MRVMCEILSQNIKSVEEMNCNYTQHFGSSLSPLLYLPMSNKWLSLLIHNITRVPVCNQFQMGIIVNNACVQSKSTWKMVWRDERPVTFKPNLTKTKSSNWYGLSLSAHQQRIANNHTYPGKTELWTSSLFYDKLPACSTCSLLPEIYA